MCVERIEQHDIEAARAVRHPAAGSCEPAFGGVHKAGLLCSGYACGSAAKVRVAAQSDFNENDPRPVCGDKVDFAPARANIAINDREPVSNKMRRRQRLRATAVDQVRWLEARCLRRLFYHLRDAFMDLPEQPHYQSSGIRALHASPALYVVATPLGNLGDITLRALETLARVDVIAAEDTRHTRRLLDHHGIRTRVVAVHQHNENAAADGLVALIEQGQHVALVTDAGTPAVSDPGARVVARVQRAGFPVVPVPGPSAVTTALSVSGLVEGRFLFVGFLPSKRGARCSALESLSGIAAALIFYEAPHRVAECVEDLVTILGGSREIVVARELTKMHEQIARMPLSAVSAWFAADANRLRGEFVLVVSPALEEAGISTEADKLLRMLVAEMPTSRAVKIVCELMHLPKKLVYEYALALSQKPDIDLVPRTR